MRRVYDRLFQRDRRSPRCMPTVSIFMTIFTFERAVRRSFKGASFSSCECHGHGFTCDPVTGEKCNCGNNTESDSTCTSGPMKGTNTGNPPCWMVQCSKCKENYAGTPIMGHQCYKIVTADNKMCFDTKLIGEQSNKRLYTYTSPPWHLSFF